MTTMNQSVLLIVLSVFITYNNAQCDPSSELVLGSAGVSSEIICVNFKTGETRSILKTSFEGTGLLTANENMMLFSSHLGKLGMVNIAVTVNFPDKSELPTGPGLDLKDYVVNWQDLFYDYKRGSIYATIDLPVNQMYERHIFKYDTPNSQNYTSILNFSLPCGIFCLQITESPITSYNPDNQTYWLIFTDSSDSSYLVEIDLEKGVVNYIYENSISGYFGYSALKFNSKDNVLYGILPNTTNEVLLETLLVKFEGRTITKILELDLPKNVTIIDGANLPSYVDIDFENNMIFYAYASSFNNITINVLDFNTGNLLNKLVINTDFIWGFSAISQNTNKIKHKY